MKPKRKIPSNFANNNALDAAINKMSGEKMLTYDEVHPVVIKKIDELTKEYTQKQAAFNKKYDESKDKRDILFVLDTMKNADPDLTITLVVESIECRKYRSRLGVFNHLLGQMRKEITYPADSIEKLEKL